MTVTWMEGVRGKKSKRSWKGNMIQSLKISNKSLWRTPERINQRLKTPQNHVLLPGEAAAVPQYANPGKLISQR